MTLRDFVNAHTFNDGLSISINYNNKIFNWYFDDIPLDLYTKNINAWYYSFERCCIIVELEK